VCFLPGGFLVHEFDNIFSDLFLHDSALYRNIVSALVSDDKDAQEICAILDIPQTGRLSGCLEELRLAGFVTRDYTWNIKSGLDTKLSRYRLSDAYIRFYLKYIEPNRTRIDRGMFTTKTVTALPAWQAIMGLQFENLILHNRHLIHEALHLRPEDIVSENPFFQYTTAKQPGCQIDYMIQTRFNSLYVCEIKFSQNIVGESIIEEVQQKIDRLCRPRAYSVRPVLIHVNGVSDGVE